MFGNVFTQTFFLIISPRCIDFWEGFWHINYLRSSMPSSPCCWFKKAFLILKASILYLGVYIKLIVIKLQRRIYLGYIELKTSSIIVAFLTVWLIPPILVRLGQHVSKCSTVAPGLTEKLFGPLAVKAFLFLQKQKAWEHFSRGCHC